MSIDFSPGAHYRSFLHSLQTQAFFRGGGRQASRFRVLANRSRCSGLSRVIESQYEKSGLDLNARRATEHSR